jgi:hypothetical protein
MKSPSFQLFPNRPQSNRRGRAAARAARSTTHITPALLSVTVGLLLAPAAHATIFTYTAPNSTNTKAWSSGSGWTGTVAPEERGGYHAGFWRSLCRTLWRHVYGNFQA